jgi:inosine kinase
LGASDARPLVFDVKSEPCYARHGIDALAPRGVSRPVGPMRFPGKRKSKHYFPVNERERVPSTETAETAQVYIVGLDQLLVDIEANVEDGFLASIGVPKGQSVLLQDAAVDRICDQLVHEGRVIGEFAGGAVGNTLHNYSVIADDASFLLGSITGQMTVGDQAFHYVRGTSSRVSLAHLHPVAGPMGRAICFVTPEGERSFGISRGIMDRFPAEAVPESLIAGASAVLLTAYLLRDDSAPIYGAATRIIELANRHGVPVVLSLGAATVVRDRLELLREVVRGCSVSVVAGNLDELAAFTGESDPLLAGRAALEITDLVLLTRDCHGLYIAAWVDETSRRETGDQVHSKSIPEYNRWEYSRAMARRDCTRPVAIFSHINPYLGGPGVIHNTNGAGDSALAAVLHDMSANVYNRQLVPTSPKHVARFLTYSSIHQVCKYANRVSYEVLRRASPRLVHALPEREDSLEEAYWEA